MPLADTSYDLAAACDAVANAISDARNAKGYAESGGQAATLDHLVSSLRDEADSLRTAGVAASLEAASSALKDVNDAAAQAKAVAAKLAKANQMITVAGSLITLAAAAYSGNLSGIASGAAALIGELKGL